MFHSRMWYGFGIALVLLRYRGTMLLSCPEIGTQILTVEKLKTTRYKDGTPIPNITDYQNWTELSTGAYCSYENLDSNAATYGMLYNWYAVNTGKLAAEGWHVPAEDDWTALESKAVGEVLP